MVERVSVFTNNNVKTAHINSNYLQFAQQDCMEIISIIVTFYMRNCLSDTAGRQTMQLAIRMAMFVSQSVLTTTFI